MFRECVLCACGFYRLLSFFNHLKFYAEVIDVPTAFYASLYDDKSLNNPASARGDLNTHYEYDYDYDICQFESLILCDLTLT